MAGLEQTLELDISEALAGIDQIEAALTSAVASFSGEIATALTDATAAPLELAVDDVAITDSIDSAVAVSTAEQLTFPVDEASITGDIDAAVTASSQVVEVQADASNVTDEIDQAIAAADTQLTIDADASGLVDLSEASGEAVTGLDAVENSAQGVSSAAALAGGEIGSVVEVLGKVGPEGQAAAVGLAATLGVATELFSKALELNQAEFRFNSILGDQAKAVDHINLGGLNSSLADLAIQVGGSNAKLHEAAANIFQLGTANGTAAPQVAKTTEQMIALAARAVAMKPQLGDVGDVTDQMAKALARGGRFASQFGISLTAAQINAEALKETGKTTAAELTVYEKATAGAALATAQLGNKLGTDIAKGSSSAAVQIKSLKAGIEEAQAQIGKPLVPIFLQLLKESGPLLVQVATDFAHLAEVILPLAEVAIPILTAQFEALDIPLKLLAEGMGEITKAAHFVSEPIKDATSNTNLLKSAATGFIGPAAGMALGAFGIGTSSKKAAKEVDSLAKAADKTAKTQLDAALKTGAFTKAQESSVFAQSKNKDGTIDYSSALEKLTPRIDAAKRAEEAKTKAAVQAASAGRSLAEITDDIQAKYQAQLAATSPLSDSFKKIAASSSTLDRIFAAGGLTLGGYGKAIQATGLEWEQLNLIQKDVDTQVQDLTATYQKGLLGLDDAIGSIKDTTDKSGKIIHTSADEFSKAFAANVEKTTHFLFEIQALRDKGATGLAEAYLKAGVVANTAAEQSNNLSDTQLAKEEAAFQGHKAQQDANNLQTQSWAEKDIRIKLLKAIQDEAIRVQAKGIVDGTVADVQTGLDNIETIGRNAAPTMSTVGGAVIDGFVDGMGLHIPRLHPKGKEAGEAAVAGANEGAVGSGTVGNDFVQGLINGLNSRKPDLKATAASLAALIPKTLKDFLQHGSPSKVAIKIGQQFNEGLAIGLSDIDGVSKAVLATGKAIANPFDANFVSSAATLSDVVLRSGISGESINNNSSNSRALTVAPGAVQIQLNGAVTEEMATMVADKVTGAFDELYNQVRSN